MDYQLIALILMVAATFGLSIKLNSRWWPGRPGYEYQQVFSAVAGGLLFFITGLIGCDLSKSRQFLRGTAWVDGPIWWQLTLGVALLLLAAYWARHVPPRPARR